MDPTRWLEGAKRHWPWVAMPLAWLLVFGPGYAHYVAHSFDPRVLTDDTRIVLPNFYRFADSGLFRGDKIGRYHSDGTPDVFRAIYAVAAQFGDLVLFSKILAHCAWLATLAGVFVTVLRLGGKAAAFVAICLCLSTDIMLDRIAGGLPRAFAFPVLAWMAAALAYGWPRALALLVVVGACLYPPLAPLGGACLALVLLVLPKQDRGYASEWSLRRRIAVLALTGAATALISAPLALRMKPYGQLIRPAMVAEFPEIGRGGRVGATNRAVPPPFFEEATALAKRTVFAEGEDLVPALKKPLRHAPTRRDLALTALTLAGLIGYARFGLRTANAGARRLCTLGIVSFLGYVLGTWLNPALGPPQRFAHFPVPLLVLIALPVAALGACPRRWFAPDGVPGVKAGALVLGVGVLLLGCFGSRDPLDSGLEVTVYSAERKALRAIAKLPKRSVIAGWPYGTLDHVPLLTKRTTLISYQTYQPYHTRMTLRMRERMRAMLDVYFQPESPDLNALRKLRDKFGVTHFLLDKVQLQRPPRNVFNPLGKDVETRVRSWRMLPRSERRMKNRSKLRRAMVFEDAQFAVIDLKKLDRGKKKKRSKGP